MKPLVSILILNWNGEKLLEECIKSVLSTTYKPIEVVVVDNASNDRSLEVLKLFPDIRIVQNSTNMGYAGGNNIGFTKCDGKYVVTLNNDVTVKSNWLDQPIEILETNDDVGIISCCQLNYFDKSKIDVLFSFPTYHLLLGRMGHGKKNQNCKMSEKIGYVLGANGASAIYRKTLLNQLFGFEYKFFAYQEECDLHMRAFYNDWKCVYVPTSIVYHKENYSFKKLKKTFFYYHERNRIWFIYRNFPLYLILLFSPIIIFREIRTMFNIVFRKRMPLIYLKARIDGFGGMLQFKNTRCANLENFNAKKVEFLSFLIHKILPLKNNDTH